MPERRRVELRSDAPQKVQELGRPEATLDLLSPKRVGLNAPFDRALQHPGGFRIALGLERRALSGRGRR